MEYKIGDLIHLENSKFQTQSIGLIEEVSKNFIMCKKLISFNPLAEDNEEIENIIYHTADKEIRKPKFYGRYKRGKKGGIEDDLNNLSQIKVLTDNIFDML